MNIGPLGLHGGLLRRAVLVVLSVVVIMMSFVAGVGGKGVRLAGGAQSAMQSPPMQIGLTFGGGADILSAMSQPTRRVVRDGLTAGLPPIRAGP